MPVVRLTAKERILVHLADYAKYADAVEVPPEMGQERLAHAAGIRVQHVRQFLDPLLKDGLVHERTAHVRGHRRKLRVYDLTETGLLAAARLRERMRDEAVRVRDAGGVRDTTIGELARETKGKVPLGGIVRAAMEGQAIDLTAHGTGPHGFVVSGGSEVPHFDAFVERLGEAPRLGTFVGRREELDALTRDDAGPRLFFVRGVAGIGKSSFAAKVCERLRGTRNLFWHRVRPWDTRASILAALADFLEAVGRPGLRAVLGRGEVDRADHVVRGDLPGTRAVLIFDDAHEATPEVRGFLRFLKDTIAEATDVRAIVLSRRALPIYDRRDVTIRGLVGEIELRGLDTADIEDLLSADPGGARIRSVARSLGGHPLFLELLRSPANHGIEAGSIRDVRRFIEEEIYSELSDPERRMMKAAALYAVPFPREAVFADPTLSHDVLVSLAAKSLIRAEGEDSFGVHDTIRDFFVSILSPAEREALFPLAVVQLRRLSEKAEGSRDFVAALNALSNARDLALSDEQRGGVLEALGDTQERIGNLPDELTAYREALECTTDPESRARLHRKIAAALIVRGDIEPASAEIQTGYAELGDRASVERGWFDLLESRMAGWREDWSEALAHGEAALAAFHGASDPHGQAHTSLEIATVHIYSPRGNPEEAERYLMSALEISRASRDREFEARLEIALANLYANRIGDAARAKAHWQAVDALEESIGDPHIRRSLFMIKGWFVLYQEADYRAAAELFTHAVALARRIHDPATLAFAQYGLATTLYFDGRFEEARGAFERFAVEMDSQASWGYAMEARWMVAECCLRLEDLAGFRRIGAEFRDPRRTVGVAARRIHAKVIEGLECVLDANAEGCESAFQEAFRLLGGYVGVPDAMLAGFLHLFYAISLRAIGRMPESEESLRETEKLLSQYGLRAQLSLLPAAVPQVTEFLRCASKSESEPERT